MAWAGRDSQLKVAIHDTTQERHSARVLSRAVTPFNDRGGRLAEGDATDPVSGKNGHFDRH
jgi:hypothetical protein